MDSERHETVQIRRTLAPRHDVARARAAWSLLALSMLACGERAPATTEPERGASACPAATLDVPTSPGFPSAAVVETHARVLVQNDIDPRACLVSVVVRRESTLIEITFEGTTHRARLAASVGTLREGLFAHVVAQRLLRRLLDANVVTAVASGRGVALGFVDHTALCHRSPSAAPSCVRAPAARVLDSVTEPSAQQLVVDAISDTSGSEWALTFGETTTLTTRTGALEDARVLGAPPPAPDRFAGIRSASPEQSTPTADSEAVTLAAEMPTLGVTLRYETHAVAGTRVAILSRCDGLVPHCVSVMATERGGAWSFAPSFATDPARVDLVEDADALAPGALVVRLVESGVHEGSARDVFLVAAGDRSDAYDVTLGSEAERGEGDTATEGCYRSLTIEGANRVRLSGAQGWSGSHSARGWSVFPSSACATEATLCLDPTSGFGTCRGSGGAPASSP